MGLKSPAGRLARWALALQSFDLEIKYLPGRANVVADTLSRPPCADNETDSCPICTIEVTLPTFNVRDFREKQLADSDLSPIIKSLEQLTEAEDQLRWLDRGFLMDQGLLYRYNPDIVEDIAQLVIPESERLAVLEEYHNSGLAGHNGIEGTYNRIAKRYHWPAMRQSIKDYIKRCQKCQRYKISNMKPVGLLQTPVLQQRFETLSVDSFGPLPETDEGLKWILIVEDVATKWVELFPLTNATSPDCARVLVDEVFFRFGTPRKLITDNGSQFVGEIMQHILHCLGVQQIVTPVYHPEANPVERKNRELKTQLSILVENEHRSWAKYLPAIRFALNTAHSQSTGNSAAFLTFGTDLRTPDDVRRDLRTIVQNELFVEQATPYLIRTAQALRSVRDHHEQQQDRHKRYADRHRRAAPSYEVGDKVLVAVHSLSNKKKALTSKFMPKRDGPYVIINRRSPTTYAIEDPERPGMVLGVYHTSQLTPYLDSATDVHLPLVPIRRRGRPKKKKATNTAEAE